jgi:hypothetical protein
MLKSLKQQSMANTYRSDLASTWRYEGDSSHFIYNFQSDWLKISTCWTPRSHVNLIAFICFYMSWRRHRGVTESRVVQVWIQSTLDFLGDGWIWVRLWFTVRTPRHWRSKNCISISQVAHTHDWQARNLFPCIVPALTELSHQARPWIVRWHDHKF